MENRDQREQDVMKQLMEDVRTIKNELEDLKNMIALGQPKFPSLPSDSMEFGASLSDAAAALNKKQQIKSNPPPSKAPRYHHPQKRSSGIDEMSSGFTSIDSLDAKEIRHDNDDMDGMLGFGMLSFFQLQNAIWYISHRFMVSNLKSFRGHKFCADRLVFFVFYFNLMFKFLINSYDT